MLTGRNPASNAPTEVLVEIFRLALHADVCKNWGACSESRIPTAVDTPWPFMLALDAALWSTFIVCIRPPESPCDDVSRLPTIFEHVLSRSGRLPLTIKLAFAPTPRDGAMDESRNISITTFTTLARIALDHCERWRTVFLHVDYDPRYVGGYDGYGDVSRSCLGDLRVQLKRMPMLKSLEVENKVAGGQERTVKIEVVPHRKLETLRFNHDVRPIWEAGAVQQCIETGFPSLRKLQVVSP